MVVALLFSCCCHGSGCSPRSWNKQKKQVKLFSQLQHNMELMEETNNKIGHKALEMEEGIVGIHTEDITHTTTRPYNPSDPTLGAPH